MRIAFRVDASPWIGTGHVMRCITLADALASLGAWPSFVSRHLPEQFRSLLAGKGYAPVMLATHDPAGDRFDLPHSHWLQASQAADAAATRDALEAATWDWLVVDHYALDARWEHAVRERADVGRVLVIDDLADRPHDCELLVDQNLYSDGQDRYRGRVPEHCELLLGPGHALLRVEFKRLRAAMSLRDGPVKRILVMLGGADSTNQTEKATLALERLGAKDLQADIVIGGGHPAIDAVRRVAERAGYECHVNTLDVAPLMARADLAIGASGSTSWERCCLSLPTICLTLADNQVRIAEELARAGAVVNLGDATRVRESDITECVRALLADPERVRSLSRAAGALVDGRGVERVCRRMLQAA